MTWLLVKLGVRIVVFTAVFALAVWRSQGLRIERRWAVGLVGLVFALLNTALYGLLSVVLNVATFGIAWLFAPFLVNALFLWATGWLLRKIRVRGIEIDGLWMTIKLAALLTLVHGGLHLAFGALLP
jgi:uncharacterized membrane protein YvlD (DUF360 family)